MKTFQNNQSGFSAIELLITLFIAAAFIGAGYQLYTVVLKSGGETQKRTTANNIAYNNLRRHTPNATTQCSVSSPSGDIPADSGLPSPSIDIDITCPYGVGESVSKIQVVLTYGSPTQEVVHAMYVNGN